MKKKITCLSAFVAVLIAVGCISFGCTDDFFPPEENIILESIDVDDIPEGIVPMEFKTRSEAIAFINKIKKHRETNPIQLIINDELGALPLMKTRAENYGSMTFNNIPGWWFQSLNVYLSWDTLGGPVAITSSMNGFTLGVGWEQMAYSAFWAFDNRLITFEITGMEIYYLFYEGIGEVFRNEITVKGQYSTFLNGPL